MQLCGQISTPTHTAARTKLSLRNLTPVDQWDFWRVGWVLISSTTLLNSGIVERRRWPKCFISLHQVEDLPPYQWSSTLWNMLPMNKDIKILSFQMYEDSLSSFNAPVTLPLQVLSARPRERLWWPTFHKNPPRSDLFFFYFWLPWEALTFALNAKVETGFNGVIQSLADMVQRTTLTSVSWQLWLVCHLTLQA